MSKWAEIPGLDDVYPEKDDGKVFELREVDPEKERAEKDPDCEYALEVRFPKWWYEWIPFIRWRTSVWLYTRTHKWTMVAKFISPLAGYTYARDIARKLEKVANALAN
jgi:hypothetical protein